MKNIFFFQTQQIHDNTNLFDQLKKQNIFYSYFQVDQNYYLFIFSQKSIDINFFYQSVKIIEELDFKQRKIRSLRGFFLYALETMEKGKEYEILETNLQPFFWRKIKNIIRQNKKAALQEFLFGKDVDRKPDNQVSNPRIQILEDQIQNLQNQVDSLQQKIIQLESKLDNSKYPLNGALEAPDTMKSIQLGDSTLKQNKAENKSNFVTLSQISEEERVEIIKKGFQLQAEGKISLKKYYESTDSNSLFQLKGYRIKYEAIRKNKFYQQLKQ